MRIEPLVLKNRWVRLEPFAPGLKAAVRDALNVDEAAWSIMVSTAHGEHFDGWWDGFVERAAAGRDTPYAVQHAFDSGAVRVEIITDGINTRSQAAIAKLGAVREGVLRRHKITHTGRVRDTVMFSITDEDWPAVRGRLDARLAAG